MAKYSIELSTLEEKLARHGLSVLGGLQLAENHCAKGEGYFEGQYAILVGNKGGEMWPYFAQSDEYCDGNMNPMNRWTVRVISDLIDETDFEARYPFDEPYWPFQRIAHEAMNVQSSPLGILIHLDYGLWHAFRAIIIVSQNSGLAEEVQNLIHQADILIHPCDNCIERPCLNTCPVSAFDGESLDRSVCFQHLDSGNEPDCMKSGCMARNVCPIGAVYKYESAQIEFHMKSYRGV